MWVVVRREIGGLQGSVKLGLLATNSITGTGREIRVISVLIHVTVRVRKRCDIVPHTPWRLCGERDDPSSVSVCVEKEECKEANCSDTSHDAANDVASIG